AQVVEPEPSQFAWDSTPGRWQWPGRAAIAPRNLESSAGCGPAGISSPTTRFPEFSLGSPGQLRVHRNARFQRFPVGMWVSCGLDERGSSLALGSAPTDSVSVNIHTWFRPA